MGNNFGFLYINKEPLFTLGPDYKIFFITWTGFVVLAYVLVFHYSEGKGNTIHTLTKGINLLQIISYLLTAVVNPGIASAKEPFQLEDIKEYQYFCERCQILRVNYTYHCHDCDICIKGHDHHCPWTGKCIGQGNIIFFKIFITSTTIYFIFCITILLL